MTQILELHEKLFLYEITLMILILLANFLYISRFASEFPNLTYYKNCALSYKTLEKYVAKVNNRNDEFKKKTLLSTFGT